MSDEKVYGPKSKKLVLKKLRAAERMIKLAEASLETIDYEEDPEDDRPSHARLSGYSERKVVAEVFRATAKMLDSTAQLIDLYPVDDRADVVALIRRGLKKDEPEEEKEPDDQEYGNPVGVNHASV